MHLLEKGPYGPSYMIDGVHPGEESVSALRDALHEAGWSTWQYSNDNYRVSDAEADDADEEDDDESDEEADLPGLYLAVTAPANVPPRAIAARVAALCKGHQLCWTELARAAGESTEWHEAMEARYGL